VIWLPEERERSERVSTDHKAASEESQARIKRAQGERRAKDTFSSVVIKEEVQSGCTSEIFPTIFLTSHFYEENNLCYILRTFLEFLSKSFSFLFSLNTNMGKI